MAVELVLKWKELTFKDKNVFNFYNSNFIHFEVNTRKDEGIETNQIYKIQLHPTFIFFDNMGNEIHRIVGLFSPEIFLEQGNNALFSTKNLSNYKKLYESGNRTSNFLYDYTYMLRDANELDSTLVNEYLNSLKESDFKSEKNIRYLFEFSIVNFDIYTPYGNPHFKFIQNNKEWFYKYFDSIQVRTRIVWILNNANYKAIEQKDDNTFFKTIEIIKEYDIGKMYYFKEMDGRVTGILLTKYIVLSSMLNYYDKIGDQSNYLKTLDIYISKIWDDADELNSFAWGFVDQVYNNDAKKISKAIECSKRSIELKNKYEYIDTYAWLLYKSGNKKKALKYANKAIEMAKKHNHNYKETQKLVDIINKS
jgi:hypothetical protein